MSSTCKNGSVKELKIVVVDDHPITRYGIARMLDDEPNLKVVAEAANEATAFEAINQHNPDLLILDISLGESNGLDLTKKLKKENPDLAILILSMHDETIYASRALKSGARGYLMKEESANKLIHAINTIISGEIYVSNEVKKDLLQVFAGTENDKKENLLTNLTEREREVFLLFGEGLTAKIIAKQLKVSIKTVDANRARIKQKLGVSSATELKHKAIEWCATRNIEYSF